MSLGSAFGAFAGGFADARHSANARKEREADRAQQDRYLSILEKNPGAGGGGMGMGAVPPGTAPAGGSYSSGGGGGSFAELLRRTEGAGDYDTLFGHAQREGGRFAGVRPSQMTLGQLYEFANPKGEYGRYVAERNNGVVGTPMGAGQIVGRTLRATASAMGLSDDTVFGPQVQDRMIDYLAQRRLASAQTPEARRAALRAEWHGFKSVPDAELDAAIAGFQSRGTAMGARRPAY